MFAKSEEKIKVIFARSTTINVKGFCFKPKYRAQKIYQFLMFIFYFMTLSFLHRKNQFVVLFWFSSVQVFLSTGIKIKWPRQRDSKAEVSSVKRWFRFVADLQYSPTVGQ